METYIFFYNLAFVILLKASFASKIFALIFIYPKDSNLFEHIVISTDSDDIANIAKKYGAEVFFKRSEEMATDTAGKLDVIRDAFKRSEE